MVHGGGHGGSKYHEMNVNSLKCFVITIESLPESVEYSKRCIESAKTFGFSNIRPWTAITPLDDIEFLFDLYGVPIDRFLEINTQCKRPRNAMGCFMSHYSLWLHCIELLEPILILEHDAVFTGSFEWNRVPNLPDAALMSIGRPSYGNFKLSSKHGVNKLFSKKYLPGAHAYVVKPAAAYDLVSFAKVQPKPVDVFIESKTFPWIYEYYPWIVEARDDFTTIQSVEFGCTAKHSYVKNPSKYRIIEIKE